MKFFYWILPLLFLPTIAVEHAALSPTDEAKRISRIATIFKGNTFGIDVSEYQGIINWKNLGWIQRGAGISFTLIRASAGIDRPDNYFTRNWRESKKNGFIRGAYHYYRPNENSIKQANHFIGKVKLQKGDFPPIVDLEAKPDTTIQSMDKLRLGLKRWLTAVEKHYGVKPIIYTYENYYKWYLAGHGFEKYPLWIANYNQIWGPTVKKWKMWQFSRKGNIRGIKGNVDLNVFRGDMKQLRAFTLKE